MATCIYRKASITQRQETPKRPGRAASTHHKLARHRSSVTNDLQASRHHGLSRSILYASSKHLLHGACEQYLLTASTRRTGRSAGRKPRQELLVWTHTVGVHESKARCNDREEQPGHLLFSRRVYESPGYMSHPGVSWPFVKRTPPRIVGLACQLGDCQFGCLFDFAARGSHENS